MENTNPMKMMKPLCDQYTISFINSTTYKEINYSCSWTSILLACPTTVLNLLLIMALGTSRDRRKPCNILLLNLAITDVLSGVINMPGFFVIFRYIAEERSPCFLIKLFHLCFLFASSESFLLVACIAVERYISIFYPFFHASKLSLRNVAVCIGISWALSISELAPIIVGLESTYINAYILTMIGLGMILNFFCYLRILLRARAVRLQIQNEATRFGQSHFSSTDKRYIYLGLLIIISLVLCFTPLVVTNMFGAFGYKEEVYQHVFCWKWTLILVNSFINPFITLSFCPSIRRKVWKILRCQFFCKEANEDRYQK